MSYDVDLKLPNSTPPPSTITQTDFRKGVITLIDQSRIPPDSLAQAKNLMLFEDGAPRPRWGTDWYSTTPTYTIVNTNHCTNPSFETDYSGWGSAPSGGSIARVTTDHYVGTACLQYNGGTGANGPGIPFSLIIGNTYTLQLRIKAPVGTQLFLNPAPATGQPTIYQTATGGWDLMYTTFTVTRGGAIYVGANVANTTFYLDAVMIEDGTALNPYFDGNSTNTSNTSYAWTGTTNDSTSTQTITGNTAAIDGATYFDNSDGTVHLVQVAAGRIFRSLNDGQTWTQCTGATLTAGKKCYFEQAAGELYIVDGVDNIVRYNGTTTLQTYNSLSTPGAPSITQTGMTGTSFTGYYRISAVNAVGFTAGSATGTIQTSQPRTSWSATQYAALSWTAVSGALYYDIYFTDSAAQDALNNEVYVTSVGGTSWVDNGSAPLNNSIAVPIQNTTQGPTIGRIKFIGQILWGTEDPNNKYRCWWTGAGNFIGYFSAAYQGGYVDLQPGGHYFPVAVEDYRNGQGTPMATVWCKSSNGQGCIFQVTLNDVTVGSGDVLTPSVLKLPGSRGTAAPNSIVNVLNDYMYYNTIGPAIYNLGSRAQFLNLLSTDEASINIRPSLQNINSAAASGICATYYLAKVMFSVPYNSNQNNAIVMYDTEQQCWLDDMADFGVERFLQYGDNEGQLHLLFWKPGDTQLSEMADIIKGDYGEPFQTVLTTGLVSVGKDRFEFSFVSEGDVELSDEVGIINVTLLGIDRNEGYGPIASRVISTTETTGSVGWSTFKWSTTEWSSQATPLVSYSEPSAKRYFIVSKELNAYQWQISTNDLNTTYRARTLQVIATPTMAGKPRQWLLIPS